MPELLIAVISARLSEQGQERDADSLAIEPAAKGIRDARRACSPEDPGHKEHDEVGANAGEHAARRRRVEEEDAEEKGEENGPGGGEDEVVRAVAHGERRKIVARAISGGEPGCQGQLVRSLLVYKNGTADLYESDLYGSKDNEENVDDGMSSAHVGIDEHGIENEISRISWVDR